jgi:glutaminyl-tRNA synthetase
MYRIITTHPHHRTGNTWKVYPMYDFAHGQSDYFEGVTHSLCTLEFEVHRPLYNWFIDQFADSDYRPKQREFNRLNLTYTVMSKRKMLQLVKEGLVRGWDDPRMPTICGLRRRGYTPEAIHDFIYNKIGFTKYVGLIDFSVLESSIREDLNKRASRVCAVINPTKLIITNYPDGQEEMMTMENNPEDETAGTREVPFCKELYIEKEDFMEEAPKKYFRLTPGNEVRLKGAYIVKCTGCKKDEQGNVTEVYAEYDPLSKSGSGTPESNRKIKGTIHWVSVKHALPAEIRIYDRLFSVENPSEEKEEDFRKLLNPDSLKIVKGFVEPSLANAKALEHYQFQRIGYFNVDPDSKPGQLVFNRTVSLKDSWAKIAKKE